MVILCTEAFAQTPRDLADTQEITVNYGQITVPQFIYGFANVFGIVFSFGNWKIDDTHFYGAVGAEYNYWLNNRFAVGGIFTNDNMLGTGTKDDGTVNTFKFNASSLMACGKVSWFEYIHFGMYSKIGLGASAYVSEGDVSWAPAFQLTPVGCDFGGEQLRGVFEIGFGNQGLFLAGIRYKF